MPRDKKVITGFLWRFAERCGAQGVTFLVSIVLARLLNPVVYGTVALVTVFTSIMQVFVDSGLSNNSRIKTFGIVDIYLKVMA